VGDLLVDRAGRLWIGTRSGGLNRLDPDSTAFVVYRHDRANLASLSHDTVRGLAEDARGFIWVGTADGGLNRLDPGTGAFTHFRHDPRNPSSLGDDGVYALHVDRAGRLWVGLQGAGVDRFQPSADGLSGTFVHYRQRDGLASDEVLSIMEDGTATEASAGNIWVATGRGLARIDAQTGDIRTYGAASGIPSAPLTRGHDLTPDGRLLFGSSGGVIGFDPHAALPAGTSGPPIVFTDFQLDNRQVVPGPDGPLRWSIDATDVIELNWSNRIVSIEFAALSYRAPDLNRYRYMLEGFDRDWTEVDSRRRLATYTNLDPGMYVFRVTGSSDSGVFNPSPRSLVLIISPPWWATWWFRGLVVVSLAAALVVAYVWRERRLKAQQHRLEALVSERTQALESALETRDVFLRTLAHDLKAPLASLAWHVQVLGRRMRGGRLDPLGLDDILQAIRSVATEAVSAIDELHDLTRLAAGAPVPLQREPVDLIALARQLVLVRVASSQRTVHFESDETSLIVQADRARLTRVLDNLLDNATKYSAPGTTIHVGIERECANGAEWAVLRVQDHGMGIPERDLPYVFDRYRRGSNVALVAGEGLGLASVQQLVELHAGKLEVDSREGVGTIFRIKLPLEHSEVAISSS
jgi:signal transduction histidine kinase